VQDRRPLPRTPTAVILKSSVAMFWARLGSLNALESVNAARFWKRWMGWHTTSADTMGRVQATVSVSQLRDGLHDVYARLKRNKALPLNLGHDVAQARNECETPNCEQGVAGDLADRSMPELADLRCETCKFWPRWPRHAPKAPPPRQNIRHQIGKLNTCGQVTVHE
jgi:hypothetical protein